MKHVHSSYHIDGCMSLAVFLEIETLHLKSEKSIDYQP